MRLSLMLIAVLLSGFAAKELKSYSYVQVNNYGQFSLDGETLSKSALLNTLKKDRAAGEKVFVCVVTGQDPLISVDFLHSLRSLDDYEIILGMDDKCDSSWPEEILADPNGLVSITLEDENAN